MSRKPREFVDGGIYHVFDRGNNRKALFRSGEDFACLGKIDDLVMPNVYYTVLEKNQEVRQTRYRESVGFEEPYVQMIEKSILIC